VLRTGKAMDTWRAMIRAQGGDPGADRPAAPVREVVTASASGVLGRLDAYAVGVAAWRLGAGRARKEDTVSASAGVLLLRRQGETVTAGEPILELRTQDAALLPGALDALSGGISIGPLIGAAAPPPFPLVLGRISG
jgi:thymidine phosphorylase